MALTAIIGLILILAQVNQLVLQNSYLESTIRQTYRPLGTVKYSLSNNYENIKIKYASDAKPGRFTFGCDPYLYNKGRGVLLYIGAISFVAKNDTNFRWEFLNGHIDSIDFDGVPTYARGYPIRADEYLQVPFIHENLDLEKRYFVCVLYLYEDQEGNLYDTERMDVIDFGERPEVLSGNLIPKLSSFSYRERYHYYSQGEKSKIIEQFKRLKHPLATFLSDTPNH
jgi:hypothetical protein